MIISNENNLTEDLATIDYEDVEILKKSILEFFSLEKLEDIIVIDLSGKSDIADYLMVATGRSSKHIFSSAEKLVEHLSKEGYLGLTLEGDNKSNWILIDALDIIIHFLTSEARELYQIEKLWQNKDKKPFLDDSKSNS